jgi:hypothetical protein
LLTSAQTRTGLGEIVGEHGLPFQSLALECLGAAFDLALGEAETIDPELFCTTAYNMVVALADAAE